MNKRHRKNAKFTSKKIYKQTKNVNTKFFFEKRIESLKGKISNRKWAIEGNSHTKLNKMRDNLRESEGWDDWNWATKEKWATIQEKWGWIMWEILLFFYVMFLIWKVVWHGSFFAWQWGSCVENLRKNQNLQSFLFDKKIFSEENT